MINGQAAIRVAVDDRQLPIVAIEEDGRVPRPARFVQVFTQQQPILAVAAPTPTTAPSSGPIAPEQPAPGTRVASAYPTISANLPVSARSSIATLQMLIDNNDVTRDARYSGTFVTYIPRDGLMPGTHTVSIRGTASDGRPFQRSWSFETTTAPAPDVAGQFAPAMPIQLNVSGNQFVGGAPINVQMTAPPGGQAFAFVCTSAWQFPLYAAPSSPFYSGIVPTAAVGGAINCPVTAMYVAPDGSVTYSLYPVFVQLLPTRTPSPASTPVPTPVPKPTVAPTARPTPASSPVPTATRIPLPTPVRRTPPPQTPVTHRIVVPRVRVTPAPQ